MTHAWRACVFAMPTPSDLIIFRSRDDLARWQV